MKRESSEPQSLIPRALAGVQIRDLPIAPAEAFVLSSVDGRAGVEEISLITGLPRPEVETVLARLATLGAVAYGAPDRGESALRSKPPTPADPAPADDGGSGRRSRVVVTPREDPLYDPTELDEPADLPPDRRKLILDTFYRLEKLTHYELLDVATTAEKKAIKSAYYGAVAIFHPDKYFGKDLGSFKQKLEKIFARLTEAHDTLTRPDRRAEYDRYVDSQRATRPLDATVEHDLETIRREIEDEASERRSSPDLSARASSIPPAAPPPRASPIPPAAPARSSYMPPALDLKPRPLTVDERRRALARKLGGTIPPPPREDTASQAVAREAAAEALKQRYQSRVTQVRDERVKRFVEQAEQAAAEKNFASAANALRIAASLAPEDTALAARFATLDAQASAVFADKYLEQARYDERRGHYLEAAQAYERVLRGRPSAPTFDRAAACHLECDRSKGADLKRAVELSKKAVELSPKETAYRITLARIYARAGMDQSALGELERARMLDPNDDTIKDWIKRVKRGET